MKKRTLPSKPTIEAMQYMAKSLREKFNSYSTVQIDAWSSPYTDENELRFWISVNDGHGSYRQAWNEIVTTFNCLMAGDPINE